VQGSITRAFGQRGSDGIGFDTPAGRAVSAAEAGQVLAITETTEQIQVLVVRHSSGLLTVYGNIDDLTVARGDRVRRGQTIAKVSAGGPGFFYFEVRDGTMAVDPVPYLQ
jgi:septal ring factor EnvC (AmiA/AmiB activator)